MDWTFWTNPGFLIWLVGITFVITCLVALCTNLGRLEREAAERLRQRQLDEPLSRRALLSDRPVEDQQWA